MQLKDMIEFSKNKWKYSAIALAAVLAVGFSFPDAFALATTDSILAVVKDIQAKVNNSDYGLQALSTKISALPSQTSIGNLQSGMTFLITKINNLPNNPASVDSVTQQACRSVAIQPYANLFECSLKARDLQLADLSFAYMPGADLSFARLKGATMHFADLNGANLENADLHLANLNEADFLNANLKNANLDNAQLSGTDFGGADLTGATFTDCTGTPIGSPAAGTLPTCS